MTQCISRVFYVSPSRLEQAPRLNLSIELESLNEVWIVIRLLYTAANMSDRLASYS